MTVDETIVHPGDLIGGGYRHEEPQWWHDIKDGMENNHLLRKCDFIERIPDTGDACPGVATHSDHYYCIFGNSDEPSWYCTCNENEEDYHFHCNPNAIMSVNEIQNGAAIDAIYRTVLFESTTTPEEEATADEIVHPGDLIDEEGGYRHEEHQWWHDMKNGMENQHLLRKCDFIERIPDTGDSCPGVATHSDHYFCIFGYSDRPSWYCTCYEHEGDYRFHCNQNTMITVNEIQNDQSRMIRTMDQQHIQNGKQYRMNDGNEEGVMKWSSGFAFGVGLTIGVLFAGIIISIHLRCRRRRNNELDPTLGTTTAASGPPPTGVITPAKVSQLLREDNLIFL